jgi:hypothetical protein
MLALATLPLFVVLGRRGAGKTSLLNHSGLSLRPQAGGKIPIWASEVAAFVEHDVPDDPRAGVREREALVRELVGLTRTRPLAGVLVVVPVGELDSDAIYAALRPAIDAIVTACGALVPIHLVVTHLDTRGGYAGLVAATSRDPSVLGVRLSLVTKSEPDRWDAPIAKMLDAVLETSIALMNGAARHNPLRFGLGMRELAAPLSSWMRRLETPTRGAEPLLPRSVLLTSTTGANPLTALAMQAIVDDAPLSRVGSRRLTSKALRWTLPTSLAIALPCIGLSLFFALRSPPAPEPEPEAPAEAPAAPAKKKRPGFVPDARPIGPKFPPEVCAAAIAAAGEWKFQTMVTATNPGSESGVGIRGIYTLDLDPTECNLDLVVTKTGHFSAAGSPTTYAKEQVGVDPVEEAFVDASGETEVLWIPVLLDMNNESGTDPLKQEFVFGFRIDGGVATRITGEWRQAGSARASTGYWGYIEGGRESIDPAPASAQVCRVQCRLACGWGDDKRVKTCREGCTEDVLAQVTTCPS